MFFEKKVDTRSRKTMVEFLAGHYRYSTANSWNGSSSYANRVKIHSLGLSSQQQDGAYALLDTEFWHDIQSPIDEFTAEMGGNYTIGSNGRSGGYLVLYNSRRESTEHKSFCRTCGQRNFKTALRTQPGTEEFVIASAVIGNGGCWGAETYLEQSTIMAVDLPVEQKLEMIRRFKVMAKDTTIGNRCGRCGTEGDMGRANYSHSPMELRVFSTSIDDGEEFHPVDWSMAALRDRVDLVRRFDAACDDIRSTFISLIDNCKVVEETVMVPKVVKKIVCCHAG